MQYIICICSYWYFMKLKETFIYCIQAISIQQENAHLPNSQWWSFDWWAYLILQCSPVILKSHARIHEPSGLWINLRKTCQYLPWNCLLSSLSIVLVQRVSVRLTLTTNCFVVHCVEVSLILSCPHSHFEIEMDFPRPDRYHIPDLKIIVSEIFVNKHGLYTYMIHIIWCMTRDHWLHNFGTKYYPTKENYQIKDKNSYSFRLYDGQKIDLYILFYARVALNCDRTHVAIAFCNYIKNEMLIAILSPHISEHKSVPRKLSYRNYLGFK